MASFMGMAFSGFAERKKIKGLLSRDPETVEGKVSYISDLKAHGGDEAASKISEVVSDSIFEGEVVKNGVEALRDIDDVKNRVSRLIALLNIEYLRHEEDSVEAPTHEDEIFAAVVHVGKTTKDPEIEGTEDLLRYWGSWNYPEKAQDAIDELTNYFEGNKGPKLVAGA